MKAQTEILWALLIACSAYAFPAAANNKACTRTLTQWRDTSNGAGGYGLADPHEVACFGEDIYVEWNCAGWLSPEGPGKCQQSVRKVIEIQASDITVDLQSHTASVKQGGAIVFGSDPGRYGYPGPVSNPVKNITIRNGRVEKAGTTINFNDLGVFPTSYEMELLSLKRSSRPDYVPPRGWEAEAKRWLIYNNKQPQPRTHADYPTRNITLDNLKIKVKQSSTKGDNVAAIIQGGNTVIRNSVLDVESNEAAILAGPNAVIENNTFIVSGNEEQAPYEEDAVIRLYHADGTVIRNNTFIIKGNANKRVLSIFATGEFTFENNTIIGLGTEGEIAKAFIGELKMKASNNTLKSGGLW